VDPRECLVLGIWVPVDPANVSSLEYGDLVDPRECFTLRIWGRCGPSREYGNLVDSRECFTLGI
jgi:hypothetical protein